MNRQKMAIKNKTKVSVRGIGAVALQNRFLGIFIIALLATVTALVTVVMFGHKPPASAQTGEGITVGSETTYCGITISGNELPDCTDGEIHVTNVWSKLTTDPEVESGKSRDDFDSGDWTLQDRKYIKDDDVGDDVFASVLVLDDLRSSTDGTSRAHYDASNYIIRDSDVVLITVLDADRNATSLQSFQIVVPTKAVNETEIYDLTSLFGYSPNEVADDTDSGNGLDRLDFSLDVSKDDVDTVQKTVNGSTQNYQIVSSREFGTTLYLTIQCAIVECTQPATLDINFQRASVNRVNVNVESDSGTEHTFTLKETGSDTGIFEGLIKLISDTPGGDDDDIEGTTVAGTTVVNDSTVSPLDAIYIFANDGDNVKVTYEDQTDEDGTTTNVDPQTSDRDATVKVDAEAPEISIDSPAENDVALDNEPDVLGTVTDDAAGLDVSESHLAVDGLGNTNAIVNDQASNRIILNNVRNAERNYNSVRANPYPEGTTITWAGADSADALVSGDDVVDDSDFEDGDGVINTVDFEIKDKDYTVANENSDQYVRYQLYFVDVAGNIGITDSEDDEDDPQPHFFLIDESSISEDDWDAVSGKNSNDPAVTGKDWDAGNAEIDSNVRDSIWLFFPDRLDVDTISPSDFRVTSDESGVTYSVERVTSLTPDDVDEKDLNGDGNTGDNDTNVSGLGTDEELESEFARYVFLKLNRDIPSGDTPKVRVVGSIDDRAGNAFNNIEVDAVDGIAPKIDSVVISGGSGSGDGDNGPDKLTDDKITIDITIDETGVSASKMKVFFVEKETYVHCASRSPTKTGQTSFKIDDVSVSTGCASDAADGVDVFIVVQVEDKKGNRAIFGIEERTGTDGSVLIFGGTAVSETIGSTATNVDPNYEAVGVDRVSTIDDYSDNLSFKFDSVKTDFTTDGGKDITTSDKQRAIVFELNEEVAEVTKAELEQPNGDTIDIMDALSTSDNETWVYKSPDDLEVGTYKASIEVTDWAGNESDELSYEIEVEERDDFSLKLREGWNAVSFPSNPSDSDINAVFTNDSITRVLTYEPWSRNPWKASQRSGGRFSGDITDIKAGIGYWVFSGTFEDQKVLLQNASEAAGVGIGSTPSTIRTWTGWNFIGVLDPNFASVEGKTGDALKTAADADYTLTDYLDANDEVTRVYEYSTINEEFTSINISDGTADTTKVGTAYWVYIGDDPADPIAP